MRDFGTGLTEREINILFNYFDRDQNGHINYDEFLLGIRGKLNNFRRALVNQAFEVLDADHSGELTIADLRDRYDAKNHPDVKSGKKTEDQVLTEFLHTFESMYDYHVQYYLLVFYSFRESMTTRSLEMSSLNTTPLSVLPLTVINTSSL